MSQLTYPRPYIILTIFVCISAAAIGVYFGTVHEMAGMLVAGTGGALVGLFWSYMMLQHTRKGNIGNTLVATGVFWGIAAAVVDTLVLDMAYFTFLPMDPDPLLGNFGLFLGSLIVCPIPGAITGFVCGLLWNTVAETYPPHGGSRSVWL